MNYRVFFVATEPSGDRLAAETLFAMQAEQPSTKFNFGIIGGTELQKASGTHSFIKTDELAIHGYMDALKAYRRVKRLVASAADAILAFAPDTVVLVDAWGFSIMLAKALKKRQPNLHIIKLVGPQVWATRAGRAKKLAKVVDHVLCLLDLEPPIYAPYGVRTTVIGLPALTRADIGDAAKVMDKHALNAQSQVLLVMPGSRPSEIKRVAPDLMATAKRVKAALPDTVVMVAPADNIRASFDAGCANGAIPSDFDYLMLDADLSPYDAMDVATYALACSGTVTTELAMKGVPMLVGYRADTVAYFLARYFLFKPNFVTLLNILDDKEIIPEFLQSAQKPDAMAKEAIKMLSSPTKLMIQTNAQNRAIPRLGSAQTPAPVKAAQAIIKDLQNQLLD